MAQPFGRQPQRVVRSHAENPAAFGGLWSGIVEDIKDPEKLGRVRVRIFELHDDATPIAELPWADPCFPAAFTSTDLTTPSHNGGFFHVPLEASLVHVMFRHGDPDYPVWMGSFAPKSPVMTGREGYTDHTPRKALYNAAGLPTCPTWGTAGGHRIEMDDDAEEIRITTAGGMKLTLADTPNEATQASQGIKLEDSVGNYLWIDTANNKMVIRFDGDLFEHITGDRHTIVEGNWYRSIGGDEHTNILGQEMRKIGQNQNVDTTGSIFLNSQLAIPQDAHPVDPGIETFKNQGLLQRLRNQIRKILVGD